MFGQQASLGRAVLDLTGDASPLQQDIDRAGRDAENALSGIGQRLEKRAVPIGKILTNTVAVVGTAVAGITTGIGKLAMDALPLEGIADAFAGITGNADEALAKLREGSLGMVRDTELMKSYNLASQLVSKSFADQLPDAMGYLSKVSAATGEDMGYMIDSLVKGVGRLSPMIIDNMAIQVQLSDATARAAEMFGKEADALTKAEQQAGMMDVVLEKLAENTASMPEVTGTAAQGLGLLRTTLANIKDALGIAVIPAFNGLLQAIMPLVERYAPGLIDFATGIVGGLAKIAEGIAVVAPSLEDIVESFAALAAGDFSTFLEGIYGIGEALGIPRETLLQVVDGVADFGFQVKGLVDEVLPVVQETIATVLETIKALWDEHGKTVIGIVGSLWGFVVGTVKMNVDYVLGYLRTWWSLLTGDWEGAQKGIQQVTDAFWAQIQNVTETVLDILAQLFGWNRDEVTTTVNDLLTKARATFNEGLETIKLWVSTALEFIRSWWDEHGENVMATIGAMWAWAQQAFSDALAWIRNTVSEALTFIRNWWDEHGENVMTIVNAMWTVIKGIFTVAAAIVYGIIKGLIETGKWIWENFGESLATIARNSWEAIKLIFTTAWEILTDIIDMIGAMLRGDWLAASQEVQSIVDRMWKAVFGIFELAFDSLSAVVTDLVNTIKGIWESIDWLAVGKGIIDGIKNGIKKGIDSIKRAARDAANSALSAAKSALRMGSPSKLFTDIGQNISDSMAGGIRQHAYGPAIEAMTMAQRTTNSVVNHTYQINHMATPADSRLDLRGLITALEMGHA